MSGWGLVRATLGGFAVALVAALLGVGGLTAASAADNWSAPADLSAAGQNATGSQVALSSDGTRATAVWSRSNGNNTIVQTASATISGNKVTWGATVSLSASGRNATGQQVALSSDGTRATVVWNRSNGTDTIIQAASATISGNTATWSTPTDLSATGQSATQTQVALSSDGTLATAVWSRYNGTNTIVQAASASITGNTATWSAVTDLSADGRGASAPQVALSGDGTRATAVWYRLNGTYNIVQSASASISGSAATWSTPIDLSANGGAATAPQVGLSSDGTRATAVWIRNNTANNIVQSASASISGNAATWSAVTDLSAIGQSGSAPQVAVSSDGTRGTAVWTRSNGNNTIAESTSASISGSTATWSAVTDLSATGQNASGAQVSLSSDGTRATAVWYRPNAANTIVQSASASITGNAATWSTPTDLSATGQNATNPQVALSGDGTRATAVWIRNNGTNTIAQSTSAMVGVPATPGVTYNPATNTLTITPEGTPAEYMITYNTQDRITAGKAAGNWASFWPGTQTTISLTTYQSAAACNPVAATATPFPGKCNRPIGEQTSGTTFVYGVSAVNANGASPFVTVTAARP